jgi:hypothetical protein
MSQDNFDNHDWGQFDSTVRRLREDLAEPTDVELDRALMTARKRADRSRSRSQHGGFMRSKIAIVGVLVAGLVTSGAGTTLAFQGGSGQGSASTAQYAPVSGEGETPGAPSTPGAQTENLGVNNHGNNNSHGAPGGSGHGTAPEAQAVRQVAATEDQGGKLPFTGLAAAPIIAIGLALLLAGAVLQRRTSRDAG